MVKDMDLSDEHKANILLLFIVGPCLEEGHISVGDWTQLGHSFPIAEFILDHPQHLKVIILHLMMLLAVIQAKWQLMISQHQWRIATTILCGSRSAENWPIKNHPAY